MQKFWLIYKRFSSHQPTTRERKKKEKNSRRNAHKHRLVKVFENLANYSKHSSKLLHKGRFAVLLYLNKPEYRWLTRLIFSYCEFNKNPYMHTYLNASFYISLINMKMYNVIVGQKKKMRWRPATQPKRAKIETAKAK